MREAGELVDINLVFGDHIISCHKVILAGRCDYFHHMFLTNMLERDSTEIVMREINTRTGILLVRYLYTGRIEITTDNAQDLLSACEMLLLGALKQDIEAFLCSHTESNNCVSIMNLASLHDMKKMLGNAKKFLHEHMKEVVETDEIRLLQEADLIEVLGKTLSQEDNFCFVQKWVKSADERAERFDDLLHHVTLSKCSDEFIRDTVMEERLMISENMWLCSDINLQTWQSLYAPPSQHRNYSACASPGGFIISGGRLKGVCKSDCYSYDAQSGQWTTLPPMSIARRAHSSIYHNECLYIVGGRDGQNCLDSVEKLDMRSLQWSRLPRLPRSACRLYLAIASNNLFALGGSSGGNWNVDVHEFDFTRQTWRQRSAMPEKCEFGAAVSFNDHVYIAGGKDRSYMQFNPLQNTWILLQRPQLSHRFGKSLVWNESILVCGGLDTDVIEAYSLRENEWSTWTLKMPKKCEFIFALKM
ncbi:hypothetical protein CAPTEDRAFT_90441 [Capitella teleta]|uniref:BTB domain-containing protein n=1 Tax=Capitella teleta TaxID=283909 RepID=R7TAH2_CAPTE|nr:hypothetical protein CAPTEDRAFT_90441 [Capitella teleta]|eukprot:ELT90728.1 hypothetical protein CAPTEDRAFT_90441 [Capitella teleta]